MLRVVISVVGVCLVLVILGAVGLIPSILCCCSKAGMVLCIAISSLAHNYHGIVRARDASCTNVFFETLFHCDISYSHYIM